MAYPLLEAREKTDLFEKELLSRFYPFSLAVIRANVPGEHKGFIESNWIVYRIFLECKKRMRPVKIFHSYTDEEGLIFFLIVDMHPYDLKVLSVKIETEEKLGRLADIDILNSEKLFSRSDIQINSYPRRKCFICKKDAIICSRNRSHSKKEIIDFILKMVHSDWHLEELENARYLNDSLIFKVLGKLTESSLLSELCRSLSCGCVTANGAGSHKDMDFLLMLNCIPLIGDAIKSLKEVDCASFEALRKYGEKVEKNLFDLTKGVNTYKGALFLLLILNACTFQNLKNKKDFYSLRKEISDFSIPVKKDFEQKNCSSASLKAFKNLGSEGVRGLVLSGFDEHFKTWLPLFERGEDFFKIILKMIKSTCDTTIIKRKGENILFEVQKKAQEILSEKDQKKQIHKMMEFSYLCEKNNISTGGTADKIIILYNLYLIKNLQYLKD